MADLLSSLRNEVLEAAIEMGYDSSLNQTSALCIFGKTVALEIEFKHNLDTLFITTTNLFHSYGSSAFWSALNSIFESYAKKLNVDLLIFSGEQEDHACFIENGYTISKSHYYIVYKEFKPLSFTCLFEGALPSISSALHSLESLYPLFEIETLPCYFYGTHYGIYCNGSHGHIEIFKSHQCCKFEFVFSGQSEIFTFENDNWERLLKESFPKLIDMMEKRSRLHNLYTPSRYFFDRWVRICCDSSISPLYEKLCQNLSPEHIECMAAEAVKTNTKAKSMSNNGVTLTKLPCFGLVAISFDKEIELYEPTRFKEATVRFANLVAKKTKKDVKKTSESFLDLT